MVNEYYQAFLNTLPDETREDVAAILGVGNLTIEKRLEYLEEYLKEKELKTCKKLMLLEVPGSSFKEQTSSSESDEGSGEDEVDLVAKLQQELNERDETISQLRKDLSENLTMTAEHLVKIAALEKAQLSEQEAGEISKQQKEREEKFDQERKRNGELTGENEKLQKEVKELKRGGLVAKLQQELNERDETISQLRKDLADKLEAMAELVGKNAALEKAQANKQAEDKSASHKEELGQEKKRNGELMGEIEKLQKEVKELKRMVDIEREAASQLLASKNEDSPWKDKSSPFPFLDGETPAAVQVPHSAIEKYTKGEAVEADNALRFFLPKEKRIAYQKWKEELMEGLPTALFALPGEKKLQITAYYKENYTPKAERRQRTLEDIIAIAHKMLEDFEKCKSAKTETTKAEIEQVSDSNNSFEKRIKLIPQEIVAHLNCTDLQAISPKKPEQRQKVVRNPPPVFSTSSTNSGGFEKIELKEYAENEPAEDEVSSLESQNSHQSDGTYVDASMNIHQPSTDETLATIKPNVQHAPAQPEPSKRGVYPSSSSEHLPRQLPRKEALSHDDGKEIKAPSEIREGSTSSTNSGGFEKIEREEYAENKAAEDEVSSLESVQHEPAQPEPSKFVYPSSPSEHLPRQVPRKEASSHDDGNHMANVQQQGAQEPNRDNVQSQRENDYNPTSSLVPPVSSAQKLDMSEYTDSLNVMLIGETGVGKTTFINAFQNYLKYPSLDDALTGGLIVPIRTSFCMVIERGENPVNIKIEPHCKIAEIVNEQLHSMDGQSRTQNAMIHEFRYTCHDQQRIIRLVDTPGVMDTRGDEKDKENYYNTMETIKRLKHIHAIFVLMKPNEGRFIPEFSRALDNIFTYLPKTAVPNVAFCFTSTEPFNFLPSETLCVLEDYLKELQKRTSVKIRAKKENIFCFDNDCFRFQCTAQQYPQYAEKKSAYERSWNNNTIQLQRMLEYLQSQAPYPALDSANIARIERRLRNLVETFANITRDHLEGTVRDQVKAPDSSFKEVILNKAKWKASSGLNKLFPDSQEEREKCFKHILKCCTFFTEFLQRSSVGIEDLFGIQLQKVILTEEKRYELERSQKSPTVAETQALVMELQRIANEYRLLNAEFKTKVLNKSTVAATPEEIETMLNKIYQLKYYGDRVATTEAMLLNPDSFRTLHV